MIKNRRINILGAVEKEEISNLGVDERRCLKVLIPDLFDGLLLGISIGTVLAAGISMVVAIGFVGTGNHATHRHLQMSVGIGLL